MMRSCYIWLVIILVSCETRSSELSTSEVVNGIQVDSTFSNNSVKVIYLSEDKDTLKKEQIIGDLVYTKEYISNVKGNYELTYKLQRPTDSFPVEFMVDTFLIKYQNEVCVTAVFKLGKLIQFCDNDSLGIQSCVSGTGITIVEEIPQRIFEITADSVILIHDIDGITRRSSYARNDFIRDFGYDYFPSPSSRLLPRSFKLE